MMRRIYMFAAVALLCLVTAACPDKPVEEVTDIRGEWQLSQISTKASIGNETVDVYINFKDGGSFELYQMLGTGRYRKFNGSWTLNNKVLSGTYEGGSPWGSTYTVEVNDGNTQMTLTSEDGTETHSYRKQSIPASVKDNAL